MCDLEERIKNIEERIEEMNQKMDLILQTINKDLSEDCKKMAKHIDFVEGVYENVKHPLNFICSKVSPLIASTDKENKAIEDGRNYNIGVIEGELDEFDPEGFLNDSDIED